jgi:hypothetical protein
VTKRNGKAEDEPFPECVTHMAALEDDDGQALYPHVSSILRPAYTKGKCTWEGGSVRIRVAGSSYRVTVHCPTLKKEASMVVATLVDVLAAVDAILGGGKAEWEYDWAKKKKDRQAQENRLRS